MVVLKWWEAALDADRCALWFHNRSAEMMTSPDRALVVEALLVRVAYGRSHWFADYHTAIYLRDGLLQKSLPAVSGAGLV